MSLGFVFFCLSSSIHTTQFINHWIVAVPLTSVLSRMISSELIYSAEAASHSTAPNVSLWSFTCGMSEQLPSTALGSATAVRLPASPPSLSPSVQLACAQFERTFGGFALCSFGLQLFPPLLAFLLGKLGLAETWAELKTVQFNAQTNSM